MSYKKKNSKHQLQHGIKNLVVFLLWNGDIQGYFEYFFKKTW